MTGRSAPLRVGARVLVLPGFCYAGEFGTVTKMRDVRYLGHPDCRWSLLVRHADGMLMGYSELDVEVLLGIATGTA